MSIEHPEAHRALLVPEREVALRVERMQARMQADSLALLWIEHLADRLCLSGSGQDGVLLVPAAGAPVFFVRKSLDRARYESPLDVRAYPGRKELLAETRARLGGGRLALALDVAPAASYAWLTRELAVEIADAAPLIRALRAVKSDWEIAQIRRAVSQVETVFAEAPVHIRAGMTELELTGWIEGRLRSLGHGGTVRVRMPGADIAVGVVSSGKSALHPTNFNGPVGAEGPYPPAASSAGWRAIEPGTTVMLDIVTAHNGYHADTTRVFYLGDALPDQVERAHAFCLDIEHEIAARLRPGRVCAEIYREVAELARERGEPPGFMGHGENRVKFFGHGVGLELDELPVIADRSDMRLETGMVVAVEPKAFLDPWGPVGTENTFVVTAAGGTSLCRTPEAIGFIATG